MILRPSSGNPAYSGQIGPRLHFFKPVRLHQRAHGSVLPEPVLDEEPRAALQMATGRRNDFPHGVEAIGASDERGLGS